MSIPRTLSLSRLLKNEEKNPIIKSLYQIYRQCIEHIFPQSTVTRYIATLSTQQAFNLFQPALPSGYSENSLGIQALFSYQDAYVHNSLYEIKNNKNRSIAKLLGQCLELYIQRLDIEPAIITWIPASKQRLRIHGYCQNELIARNMITKSGHESSAKQTRTFVSTLYWQYKSQDQKELSFNERQMNIGGLRLNPNIQSNCMHNQMILIFDDVSTTGSTLSEARELLFQAGARFVHCVAIAH